MELPHISDFDVFAESSLEGIHKLWLAQGLLHSDLCSEKQVCSHVSDFPLGLWLPRGYDILTTDCEVHYV